MNIVSFVALLMVFGMSAHAQPCVEPQALTKSVMYMASRDFPDTGGTVWVVRDTSHLITIAHVAAAFQLSKEKWTNIELRRQLYERGPHEYHSTSAIVEKIIDRSPMENIFVLRIVDNFRDAQPLSTLPDPILDPNMQLGAVGYVAGYLQTSRGLYRRMADGRDQKVYFGYPLIEVSNAYMGRLALFYGASGGPVVDCYARVWAVVSKIYETKEGLMPIRTPPGMPTNAVTLLGALGNR